MFTGIVEATGNVVSLGAPRDGPGGLVMQPLHINIGAFADDSEPGASIAVNGVCLTVVSKSGPEAAFDVVSETLKRTNLGSLRTGAKVNLERSLRPTDRLDGHFVQGHVDAIGRVQRIERLGGDWKLWLETDPAAMRFIVPKGSITLDGTSLTVVDARDTQFSVVLIPTTLERTNLAERGPGDTINIETDILARCVIHHIERLGLASDTDLFRRGRELPDRARESGMPS